jgi:hypothetical protein
MKIPSISSPLACYTPGLRKARDTLSSCGGKAPTSPSPNGPPNTFSSLSSTPLYLSSSLLLTPIHIRHDLRLRTQTSLAKSSIIFITISRRYSLTASTLWTSAAPVSIHSLFSKRRSTIDSVASSATFDKARNNVGALGETHLKTSLPHQYMI